MIDRRHYSRDMHALTARLRLRYPGLDVTEAAIGPRADGLMQQTVTFRGPLARLVEFGLVTEAMILHAKDARRGKNSTPIGDGFTLFHLEDNSAFLSLYSAEEPRERERLSVHDARKALARFRLAKD